MRDSVENEYIQKVRTAMLEGKNDLAFELSIGLKQYRESYKIG